MNTNIGITKKNSGEVAQALSPILADEFLLYTKTLRAHWNIEGPDFYSKHKLFEAQYEDLEEITDSVAERIRSLGHYAPATLKVFLELTHLTESQREKNDAAGFIKELVADHESVIIHLREQVKHVANGLGDAGTSDFITGLMEKHEKMAWMLRAHLP
jgi:starvation-inducible DNA-binding protein